MNLGKRLNMLRGNLSQSAFGQRLGVSQASIGVYEKGERLPDSAFIERVCNEYSVTADWLVRGVESEQKFSDVGGNDKIQHIEIIDYEKFKSSNIGAFAQNADALARSGLLMVPLVEAVLSAGGGSFETEGNVLDHFAFHTRWLRRKGRGRTDGMVLMRVAGDSMEPTIYNNDLVLIDQNRKDLRPGSVCAVTIEDMVYLKQIHAEPGKLILRSYNPNYAPVEIPTGEHYQDALRIIGRALWWCHDSR